MGWTGTSDSPPSTPVSSEIMTDTLLQQISLNNFTPCLYRSPNGLERDVVKLMLAL